MDNRNEMLAVDIYQWCKKKGLWGDNCIYYDGIALASWPDWHGVAGKRIAEDLYKYDSKSPLDYIRYANPDTITMSFEGPLNHVLNGYVSGWVKLENEFSKLFEKHGLYFEMGYSWSLAADELP